jgi:hypothetical protein
VVNDLKQLLRDNVADAPPDHVDVAMLVAAGRRRTRTRRAALVGGVAVLAAGAVVASLAVAGLGGSNGVDPAAGPPTPDAPVLRLADAQQAVEGSDYRVLASYTNDNLDRDNGQYLDGVTDDGLVLFRDGPRADQLYPRFALLDPATGEKDWLPKLNIGQTQTWPLELGTHRLVLLGSDGSKDAGLYAYFFDRDTRQWSGMKWPDLPPVMSTHAVLGPDDRLYVFAPASQGRVPEGGWPTGSDGEADDADAEGDTYHLWSVSLTDMDDVRDESLTVGDVAFTDSSMVWTDSANGDAGMVHVRDLSTGEETSFDPHTGDKCNLLAFGASGDRIMMSQYCGTYADEVRDDRVQILTTDGEQVATLQDSGIDGWLPAGSDVVNVSVYSGNDDDQGGTYVYDLATDRFLRLSDAISNFGLGGPVGNERQVMWHTPVNHRHGATQWVGELR